MSGRPSRNCKRRSATEMLGLSEKSPKKAPAKKDEQPKKKVKTDTVVVAVPIHTAPNSKPAYITPANAVTQVAEHAEIDPSTSFKAVDSSETVEDGVVIICNADITHVHEDTGMTELMPEPVEQQQKTIEEEQSTEIPEQTITMDSVEESEKVQSEIDQTPTIITVVSTQSAIDETTSLNQTATQHTAVHKLQLKDESHDSQLQTEQSEAPDAGVVQETVEKSEASKVQDIVEGPKAGGAEETMEETMEEAMEETMEETEANEVHETEEEPEMSLAMETVETAPVESSKAITRTYIVGKDESITGVVETSDPQASSILVNDMRHVDEDSDDEIFELVDEESRLIEEGFAEDDDSIFEVTTLATLVSDDAIIDVLNRVQPTETEEEHIQQEDMESLTTMFKCAYCKFVTLNRRIFVKHLCSEHKLEYLPWKCPLCTNFLCKYRASLAMHLNIHTTKKVYYCELCNKGFAYRKKMLVHMKNHNTVYDYRCNICNKGFHYQSTLKEHAIKVHSSANIVSVVSSDGVITHKLITESRDTVSLDEPISAVQIHDSQLSEQTEPLVDQHLQETIEDGDEQTVGSVESRHGDTGQLVVNEGENQTGTTSDAPVTIEFPTTDLKAAEGSSSRNEVVLPVHVGGYPTLNGEPFSVVITMPQGEQLKDGTALNMTAALNQSISFSRSNFTRPRTKTELVDKELLPFCEPLEQPIMFNGLKAILRCKVCPEGQADYFGSVTQFTDHLKMGHADLDIKPYQCEQCEYKCRIKGNLEQHIKFHSTVRPFQCSLCGKGFIQKYKLSLHMKFHENKRDWKCDKCVSAFNDKQDLNRHIKNVHFDRTTGVECPDCDRVFKNEYMLQQHSHIHTGKKEYVCDVCGKAYSTRESLRSHVKGHQFQFGCEICAKPLGSYSAFIAHKRLHDPAQKGFDCDVCGKNMLFKSTLEAHMKTAHLGDKPYTCDMCDKSFKTRGQLQNHAVSHSADKPYTCHICGFSVKRKDSLRQHMYKHDDVKPYRCGRCGKEYTQKQALEIHLKSKHAGITTFNCEYCDRGFNTNYQLKKHLQKHHDIDLVQKLSPSGKVIIAQTTEQAVIEAMDEDGEVTSTKKQTVLINAHICEHCQEVFVSQHALALHILSDHMQQKIEESENGEYMIETSPRDTTPNLTVHAPSSSRAAPISDTIEIPIGEEMIVVQTADPEVFTEALEQGATRIPNEIVIKSAGLHVPKSIFQGTSLLNKSQNVLQVAQIEGEIEEEVVTEIPVDIEINHSIASASTD